MRHSRTLGHRFTAATTESRIARFCSIDSDSCAFNKTMWAIMPAGHRQCPRPGRPRHDRHRASVPYRGDASQDGKRDRGRACPDHRIDPCCRQVLCPLVFPVPWRLPHEDGRRLDHARTEDEDPVPVVLSVSMSFAAPAVVDRPHGACRPIPVACARIDPHEDGRRLDRGQTEGAVPFPVVLSVSTPSAIPAIVDRPHGAACRPVPMACGRIGLSIPAAASDDPSRVAPAAAMRAPCRTAVPEASRVLAARDRAAADRAAPATAGRSDRGSRDAAWPRNGGVSRRAGLRIARADRDVRRQAANHAPAAHVRHVARPALPQVTPRGGRVRTTSSRRRDAWSAAA